MSPLAVKVYLFLLGMDAQQGNLFLIGYLPADAFLKKPVKEGVSSWEEYQ